MTTLDTIQQIHPDLIAQFFSTGKCAAIPHDVQLYLQQLQWAAEINETEHNVQKAADKLRDRIAAEQKVKIEKRTCLARIYQAIDYFCVNNNVKLKVWEETYANRFEDLASQAIEADDYKTALKCQEAALECRRRSSEIADNSEGMGYRFVITPDVTPEMLGFERKSMKEIAAKYNEGFYHKLIDSLPLDTDDRTRLLADANLSPSQTSPE